MQRLGRTAYLATSGMMVLGLAGCIYSDEPVDLDRAGMFHPLAEGYWRLCRSVPASPDTCQTVRHDLVRTNGGAITLADGSTIEYSAAPVFDRAFVLQARRTWDSKQRFGYGLGEFQTDGTVTLLSPDCRFPDAVLAAFRQAGLAMSRSFRTCPPREETAYNFIAQFRILAAHRDWATDGSATLTRIDDVLGQRAFAELRRTMGLAFATAATLPTLAVTDAPAAERMKVSIDRVLSEWSRAWRYDHYLSGSATPAIGECREHLCVVSGTFRFVRFGVIRYTIPFGATLEQLGNEYLVRSFCYHDDSSKTNDCLEIASSH